MSNNQFTNLVRNSAKPAVGMCIYLDGSASTFGSLLCEADDYSDASFPGCQFRTPRGTAINVEVTGRTFQRHAGNNVVRAKIEFVGDGQPSEFCSGWICC
tara:strand:+ start:464 stop:763 length:300 start_codon:yes stop_codon:yes gene_type:complete